TSGRSGFGVSTGSRSAAGAETRCGAGDAGRLAGASSTAVADRDGAAAGRDETGCSGLGRDGRRGSCVSNTASVMSVGAVTTEPHFGHGAETPAKWVGTRNFASQ
ncbi:MAG TPA: hypothetical protein PLA50_13015, partial [Bacteroidia bacterium]|nr:hypothetical protein [Bacteroidia bacterium]